jgi:hypothetical protein
VSSSSSISLLIFVTNTMPIGLIVTSSIGCIGTPTIDRGA